MINVFPMYTKIEKIGDLLTLLHFAFVFFWKRAIVCLKVIDNFVVLDKYFVNFASRKWTLVQLLTSLSALSFGPD